MVRYYPAVIEAATKGFGVYFPDIPGCTSGGDTLEDAMRNAEEGLQGHLDLLAGDGQDIPAPSDLAAVQVDADVAVAALVLVRAEIAGRSVRVNITMPEETLQAVDTYAKRHGYNRSNFLAYAARRAMRRSDQAA